MYGKYDNRRINREISKLKRTKNVYKRNATIEYLETIYKEFHNNIEKLKLVYPYKELHINEIITAPIEEAWRWENNEERIRTKKEIIDFGLYLPLIVLEKGFIHRDKTDDGSHYHVLDGNHRVAAIKELYDEGKISGKVSAFIFPPYCISVRRRMIIDEYKNAKYNNDTEVELAILYHAIEKLNIPRFLDIENNGNLITYVSVKNKLEIYNCAMHIGHEITPFLYLYYNKHKDFSDTLKSLFIKIK